MRTTQRTYVVLLLALVPACSDSADRGPRADGSPDVSSSLDGSASPDAAAAPRMKRGINLGNALDAPEEGAYGVVLKPAHFQLAAAAGFDHVRLPVCFSAHALASAPYTLDETFMQRVDWALDQAEANGLGVLIDMHNYSELHSNPGDHRERFLAIWRQIATRYAGRPSSLAFELLNEPHDGLDAVQWNKLAAAGLAAVRESNSDRLVVIGGVSWSDAAGLDSLRLPAGDAHLLATFHAYEPKLFANQGAAEWMGVEWTTTGVIFPGPPPVPLQPAPEAAAVGWVQDWFDRYNNEPAETNPSGPATVHAEMAAATRFSSLNGGAPTYIGEFAAVDWADQPSRINFYREVRKQAEALGIGWCVWDDGGRNRFLDLASNSWAQDLHGALFDP